jgi:breast cancer 2 susceptibility protein
MIDDLSQEDLEAIKELEVKYSQSTSNLSDFQSNPALGSSNNIPKTEMPAYNDHDPLHHTSLLPGFSSASSITNNGQELSVSVKCRTHVNSSYTTAASFTKLHPRLTTGFGSARDIDEEHEHSPASDAPPEPDYDAWFKPTSVPDTVGFMTAKAVSTVTDLGFKTARNHNIIVISDDAVEKATKLIRTWEEEVEDELKMSQAISSKLDTEETHNPFLSASTPQRQILQPIGNSFATPGLSTPTPAEKSFSRAAVGEPTIKTNPAPPGLDLKRNTKAFKPPSVIRSNIRHDAADTASPLIIRGAMTPSHTPVPKHPHPLISATPTPQPPRPTFANSQLPRLGLTPYKGSIVPKSTKKFSTPFKAGMRPGEPGRLDLAKEQDKKRLGQPDLSTAGRIYPDLTARPSTQKGKGTQKETLPLNPRKLICVTSCLSSSDNRISITCQTLVNVIRASTTVLHWF